MRRAVLVMCSVLMIAGAVSAAGRPPIVDETRERTAAPMAVQGVGMPAPGIRDEAAMVLVGTALIGLAAAVRRAA